MSTSTSSKPSERANVKKGLAIGNTLIIISMVVGSYVFPIKSYELDTFLERLVFTLRWHTLSTLTFFFGILRLAVLRFFITAIDPINGGGEHLIAIDKQYLSNTFEQLILCVFGHLVMITYITPETTSWAIPTLVILFVCGRIAFWIGYRISPTGRALGFTLTFYPCIYVQFVNAVFFVRYGPSYLIMTDY